MREDVSGARVNLTPPDARYTVYYIRNRDSGACRQSDSWVHGNRDEYVLAILAQHIAYRIKPLSLEIEPSATFHWTTAAQYQLDLRAFAADQQRRYGELISALVSMGLLTLAERDQCPLSLKIRVSDRRFDRHPAIPVLGIGDQIQ